MASIECPIAATAGASMICRMMKTILATSLGVDISLISLTAYTVVIVFTGTVWSVPVRVLVVKTEIVYASTG
jgi:hypothetical protein